jgi:hypothetical protein
MNITIKQCEYIITKGLRKGLNCITKKIFCGGLCKTHYNNKKDIIIEPKIASKIEPKIASKKSKLLSLPYDILEKIIYKPRINKELQIIFNKNIPYIYNEFINTTENNEIIKLSICQELVFYEIVYEDGIYRYRNARTEIWTKYESIDEMYNTELKHKIDYNTIWSNKKNDYSIHLYNNLLNKYKLYNKLFIKNYYTEDIFFKKHFYLKSFHNDKEYIRLEEILSKCLEYITKNFSKKLLKYDNIIECIEELMRESVDILSVVERKKLFLKLKLKKTNDKNLFYHFLKIYVRCTIRLYDDIKKDDDKIDIIKIQNKLYNDLLYGSY